MTARACVHSPNARAWRVWRKALLVVHACPAKQSSMCASCGPRQTQLPCQQVCSGASLTRPELWRGRVSLFRRMGARLGSRSGILAINGGLPSGNHAAAALQKDLSGCARMKGEQENRVVGPPCSRQTVAHTFLSASCFAWETLVAICGTVDSICGASQEAPVLRRTGVAA